MTFKDRINKIPPFQKVEIFQ